MAGENMMARDWGKSFRSGMSAAALMDGSGTWQQFLGRHAYSGAGGFAAELVHDLVVQKFGNNKVESLKDVKDEAIGVAGVVVIAWFLEDKFPGPETKQFTAGMSGRYGSAALQIIKGWVGKKKDKDAEDDDESDGGKSQGLTMDGNPRLMREVGRAMANSPDTIDDLASLLAQRMAQQPATGAAMAPPDPAQLKKDLAQHLREIGQQISRA